MIVNELISIVNELLITKYKSDLYKELKIKLNLNKLNDDVLKYCVLIVLHVFRYVDNIKNAKLNDKIATLEHLCLNSIDFNIRKFVRSIENLEEYHLKQLKESEYYKKIFKFEINLMQQKLRNMIINFIGKLFVSISQNICKL